MKYKYSVFLPTIKGSIEEEWKQCLKQIQKVRDLGYSAVRFTIFTDFNDHETYVSGRQFILDSVIYEFSNETPAVCVISMPPEKPWKVTVEALFVVKGSGSITWKSHKSFPYVILKSGSGKTVWASGIVSNIYTTNTEIAAEEAFILAVEILDKEQMSLNNIVRQWNYIGGILSVHEGNQNYQIFNEVRNRYYSRYRKVKNFPAATGVGVKYGGVILDFCAIEIGESTKIEPVDNPDQINAYSYGQNVLIGFSDKQKSIKHPPQFERGILLVTDSCSTLHISGTASIRGQETIGKEDIEKQTILTIENIRKVSDSAKNSKLVSGTSVCKEKFYHLRIYIKRQNDFKIVRMICDKYFKGIPAIYVEADICRDDLLIEIEAESLFDCTE